MTTAAHRDLLINHPTGREEDQPCALHHPKRQRQRRGTTLKLQAILLAELDPVATDPRHAISFATRRPAPLDNSTNFRAAPLVHVHRDRHDNAGKTATDRAKYRVTYNWDGFRQPITDTAHGQGAASAFEAASTIPVKYQLTKADETVVQGAAGAWIIPAKGVVRSRRSPTTAAPSAPTVAACSAGTAPTASGFTTGEAEDRGGQAVHDRRAARRRPGVQRRHRAPVATPA